jgi:hypothetical protein
MFQDIVEGALAERVRQKISERLFESALTKP